MPDNQGMTPEYYERLWQWDGSDTPSRPPLDLRTHLLLTNTSRAQQAELAHQQHQSSQNFLNLVQGKENAARQEASTASAAYDQMLESDSPEDGDKEQEQQISALARSERAEEVADAWQHVRQMYVEANLRTPDEITHHPQVRDAYTVAFRAQQVYDQDYGPEQPVAQAAQQSNRFLSSQSGNRHQRVGPPPGFSGSPSQPPRTPRQGTGHSQGQGGNRGRTSR
ncbi:hypothetical protein [Streptomyces axinellae]|uniref:Uncharacterized protein n=1 Tax=Streptomyces axinellae TaxID=552788 RepID=A0ABP6C1L8_9ACTN